MKIGLVIPCYNEAGRLACQTFADATNMFEHILFVNDGSTDNTEKVLEQLSKEANEVAQYQNISVLNLKLNVGKGEAVRAGINKLLEEPVLYDVISVTDADLSTPLSEMKRISEVLYQYKDFSIVQGARVALSGKQIERSLTRHYIGRISATMISWILELPIYDTQAGAKAFTREAASALVKDQFISRWLFDCEIYIRAKYLNLRVFEEPLNKWIHHSADSKVRPKTYFKALVDLIRIKAKYS